MSRRIPMFAAAAAALTLAGCATVSVQDVEQEGSRFSFHVDAPPATVYRRVVERSRNCLTVGQFRVEADFFPDTQDGRVALTMPDFGTLTSTRVSPAPAGGSTVTVSYYNPANRSARPGTVESIEPWARGEPGTCDADKLKPRPRPDASRPS